MKVIFLTAVLVFLEVGYCKPFAPLSLSSPKVVNYQASDSKGKILSLITCVLPKILGGGLGTFESEVNIEAFDFSKILSAIAECSSEASSFLDGLFPNKREVLNNLVMRELAQELESEEVAQEEEVDQEIVKKQSFKKFFRKLIPTLLSTFSESSG